MLIDEYWGDILNKRPTQIIIYSEEIHDVFTRWTNIYLEASNS